MREHRPYELKTYDPEWKNRYTKAEQQLRQILGTNLISIEHIGSTSIEGMLAKPQVDVLVVVKDLDKISELYDTFKKVGYTPRGREYVGNGDEYVTKDASDGRRLLSIHILPEEHHEIAKYRNFRDYLKTHEADRNLYIETKKRLFKEHKDNYEGYDSGKHEVIAKIRARADAWAEARKRE